MPVTGASIGNHIAENRESVQRDRPLPSSVGASSIIKIESEPLLDAYSQAEILDRGSRSWNRRERFTLVFCGVTNGMVAGTATRLEKLFAVQAMPTAGER